MWFRLKVGQHEQDDMAKQPDKNGKRPSKVYNQGDEFESMYDAEGRPVDLAQRFGEEKFQRIDDKGPPRAFGTADERERTPGDPMPGMPGTVFPHGQVSTGKQITGPATSGDNRGEPISGPAMQPGQRGTPGTAPGQALPAQSFTLQGQPPETPEQGGAPNIPGTEQAAKANASKGEEAEKAQEPKEQPGFDPQSMTQQGQGQGSSQQPQGKKSQEPLPKNLENWKLEDLKTLADDRGVSLQGARTKDEVIKALRHS